MPSRRCLPRLLRGSALRSASVIAVLALSSVAAADATERGRFSLIEENDSIFFNSDKHYTQGLRLSYLSSEVKFGDASNSAFAWFGDLLFPQSGTTWRHTDWAAGQSIFTPTHLFPKIPDASDRPYAGWLYLSGALIQDTDRRRLDDLAVQLGVVGPLALARQAQNDWHQYVVDAKQAHGWGSQLHDEPGLVVNYTRKWRFLHKIDGPWEVDFIPDVGASLGNVLTYAAAGGMVRVGVNLTADYGPPRIQPAQSGSDYFNPDPQNGSFAVYLLAGVEGRLVARNIFLDGSSFRSSANVDKRLAVGDINAGAAVSYDRWLRLSYSFVRRSEEFVGQHGPDRYSSIGVSVHLRW